MFYGNKIRSFPYKLSFFVENLASFPMETLAVMIAKKILLTFVQNYFIFLDVDHYKKSLIICLLHSLHIP